MKQRFDVSFIVAIDESWENWEKAELLASFPNRLLKFYLSQKKLSCCTMKAGFFMTVDNEEWGDFDEFGNAISWIEALEKLASGDDDFHVWAWEESDMKIKLFGPEIEMNDIHHSGSVIAPTIRVNLREFVYKMVREGRNWCKLGREIRKLLEDLKKKSGFSASVSNSSSCKSKSIVFDGTNVEEEEKLLDTFDKLEKALRDGHIHEDSITNPEQSINEKIALIEECFPVSLDQRLDLIESKFIN